MVTRWLFHNCYFTWNWIFWLMKNTKSKLKLLSRVKILLITMSHKIIFLWKCRRKDSNSFCWLRFQMEKRQFSFEHFVHFVIEYWYKKDFFELVEKSHWSWKGKFEKFSSVLTFCNVKLWHTLSRRELKEIS